MAAAKKGLYANIHAKQERIAHGSGEQMRKPGSDGAPQSDAFEKSEKTAKPSMKKAAAKKATAKKATAKKATAKKVATKKAATKKAVTKKTAAGPSAAKR